MRWHVWWGMGALLAASAAGAQTAPAGVMGLWQEPGGSVIEIAPCGNAVCARLVAIQANAPSQVDGLNPDASLRTRPLCGLEIGRGFRLQGEATAEDGKLYDPKSGKTYSGAMKVDNGELHLRGYVGAKIFGRTEVWKRPATGVTPCVAPAGAH